MTKTVPVLAGLIPLHEASLVNASTRTSGNGSGTHAERSSQQLVV
jgi:hypothetical protein